MNRGVESVPAAEPNLIAVASPSRPNSPVLPILAISITTLLWAGNFTAGKIATRELDPLLISSIRILAGALLFPWFLPHMQRRQLRDPGLWKTVLPLAVSGILINQVCFAAGIQRTTPGHSVIVHALIPVFVLLIAWVFLGQRTGFRTLLGVAIAISGVLFVGLSAPAGERHVTIVGDLLTMAGAIAFSAYVVIGRRVIPALGPFRAVAFSFVMAAPLAVPILVGSALAQDWSRVTWRGGLALAYMIVGATFICYTLHMWSIRHLGALKVAVFTNLQPILGTAIAQGFGEERLTWAFAGAATVVLAGVAIVQVTHRAEIEAVPPEPAARAGQR